MAKETKKTVEKPVEQKEGNSGKTFSAEEVEAMMSKMKEELRAELQKSNNVQVFREELVTILYIDEVSPKNILGLGAWGQITQSGMTLSIPKATFFAGLDRFKRRLIDDHKLIVIDGVTDEERKRFKLAYNADEVLTIDEYDNLLDYDTEKICEIFNQCCPTHKELIAKRFITAFENKDNRISQEKVEKLNALSFSVDGTGLFHSILDKIGEQLSQKGKKESK